MKIISIFLALINSLLAGVLISFLVTSTDYQISMPLWSFARILLALSIIAIGVLSWLAMIFPVQPAVLMLGSQFLVAVGPASIVWTFHRASLTGHLEAYLILYGASLFVQGICLLFGLAEGTEEVSAA